MTKIKYTATHRLKKLFNYNGKNIFRKGTPVYVPKGDQGFCSNVFFLTPTGRVRSNKNSVVHLYSKTFFKPIKEWFEVI